MSENKVFGREGARRRHQTATRCQGVYVISTSTTTTTTSETERSSSSTSAKITTEKKKSYVTGAPLVDLKSEFEDVDGEYSKKLVVRHRCLSPASFYRHDPHYEENMERDPSKKRVIRHRCPSPPSLDRDDPHSTF